MSSSKIKTIEELAELRSQYSKDSYDHQIVLSHGVFDIVHPGHIRHLQVARKEGTTLWVTLTANRFVNKGPGHPHISQHLRAEHIAALECVEYVAIHHGEAAPIEQIKPHVYAKDKEYANPDDDITGKIAAEVEAVERYGGRVVFTDEIRFSSTAIMNRYLNIYEPPLRDLLNQYRAENAHAQIMDLIDRAKHTKVVFVGEPIIDKYVYCRPLGMASKENILVVDRISEESFAGGVIAAANSVAEIVEGVTIVTAIGENDENYHGTLDLIRKSLRPNVELLFVTRENAPTTQKVRFVDPSYTRKLFEYYIFDPTPYEHKVDGIICQDIRMALDGADLAVITDYGHGMISRRVREECRYAKFLAVNAQTNAGNRGENLITKYADIDYVCIDAPEARLANKFDHTASMSYIVEAMSRDLNCRKVIVTLGAEGCLAYEQDAPRTIPVPAFTGRIVDTMGAGDVFLAFSSVLAALGGRIDLVGFVGNVAGAIKVGTVGHRQPIKKVDLLQFINSVLK